MKINKILDYSENNLSDSEESLLFSQLASDKSLRQAFKNHLRIRHAAAGANQTFAANSAITTSLFSAIGLDYADGGTIPPSSAPPSTSSTAPQEQKSSPLPKESARVSGGGFLPSYYESGIAAIMAAVAVLALVLFSVPTNDKLAENTDRRSSSSNNESTASIDESDGLPTNKTAVTSSRSFSVDDSEKIDLNESHSFSQNSSQDPIKVNNDDLAQLNEELENLKDQLSQYKQTNNMINSEIRILRNKSAQAAEVIQLLESDLAKAAILADSNPNNNESPLPLSQSNFYITKWEDSRSYSSAADDNLTSKTEPIHSVNSFVSHHATDGSNGFESSAQYPGTQQEINQSINSGVSGSSWLTSVGLEYKNYHYWDAGEVRLSPSDPPAFNNEALSLVINVYDNTDLILDGRRENFSLKFEGLENSRQTRYEAYPNFETYSLGLRQRRPIAQQFEFYGQGFFGLNNVGNVSRLGTGFRYQPFKNLSVMAGFEYSYMGFEHQGSDFNAQKSGMYYGFMLNL